MLDQQKKVEYLELIYDLIFVYIIGRNNSLLHQVENGFVSGELFLAYVFSTLAVIQIWNFSTFYINRYGKNGVREHVFLFTNMYLLYYMAEGTNAHWQASFYRYCAVWALILANIGAHYLIELRSHDVGSSERRQIRRSAAILFGEAALVAALMLTYRRAGTYAAFVPILFGILATLSSCVNRSVAVDFPHLTERAMLYVVLTFGEMIVAISSYFTEGLSLNAVYFSLFAFLIVAGLLLSYGMIYNYVIDRERSTSGMGYMLLHVFLIFALNNITTALEFMREERVALLPKTVFLTVSLVLYYTCLFLTELYAKERVRFTPRFRAILLCIAGSFVSLMMLLREQAAVSIAVTVAYVYGINAMMHFYDETLRRESV